VHGTRVLKGRRNGQETIHHEIARRELQTHHYRKAQGQPEAWFPTAKLLCQEPPDQLTFSVSQPTSENKAQTAQRVLRSQFASSSLLFPAHSFIATKPAL
jgi:hypothetical protein